MSNNTGVKINKTNLEEVVKGLQLLAGVEVLVGFPEETTARKDEDGITNAALAYIHDNGAPEAHIPARPFMTPAMEEAQDKIQAGLSGAMRQALRGDALALEMALHAVGLIAKLAIMKKINEGIPPPLSEYTLKARARRGKKSSIALAAKIELDRRAEMRKHGEDPFLDMEAALTTAKPLIDTAAMRNSTQYVIRSRKQRR
jgi:hypothetical protein